MLFTPVKVITELAIREDCPEDRCDVERRSYSQHPFYSGRLHFA